MRHLRHSLTDELSLNEIVGLDDRQRGPFGRRRHTASPQTGKRVSEVLVASDPIDRKISAPSPSTEVESKETCLTQSSEAYDEDAYRHCQRSSLS